MEVEFFVPPTDAPKWHEYWIEQRLGWHRGLGLREENLRVREHDEAERSHYSSATSDIEYLYPIGWQELEGVANRGDFDLTQHTQASGTKLEWIDPDGNRYTPHVIEPAVSIERIFVALLCDAYHEEVVGDRERVVLRLHPQVAPVKAAILPLVPRDDGMATRARALYEELRQLPRRRARRRRPDRQALSSPGRNRDAVGIHRRRTDAGGRDRDRAGSGFARAGAAADRRRARVAGRRAAAGLVLAAVATDGRRLRLGEQHDDRHRDARANRHDHRRR